MRTNLRRRRAPLLLRRAVSLVIQALMVALHLIMSIVPEVAKRLALFKYAKLDFESRPDDIFIVTYPRSGTTWMQMILYQLATDGNMNLSHISQFCPFLERVFTKRGITLLPSPRVFKTHLTYRWIPKSHGKYIYVARDGRDVAVSYFHFYKTYHNYEGTFADFFKKFISGKVQYGSWFDHVSDWWLHRNDSNVLFLRYEDLINDLEGSVRRVSKFCGFEIESERFPEVVERCSFNFMKAHEAKFDHFTARQWEIKANESSFLRKGCVGDHKEYMSDEHQAIFQERVAKQMKRLNEDFFEIGARRRQAPLT
jgi:sulfotransferase family protein